MTNMNNIRKQPKSQFAQVTIHIQELSLAEWHFKTLVKKRFINFEF